MSKLVKLKILKLNENIISDVSALSELVELEKLDLSCNKIPDISKLERLERLKIFKLVRPAWLITNW